MQDILRLLYVLATNWRVVSSVLQRDDYVIRSNVLPEVRYRPVIGNGHVATNVLSDTVYMNGVYNGQEDRSSRARIQSYMAVDVTATGNDVNRTYELDMYYGLFRQYIETNTAEVNITYFAHRNYTRLFVTQLDIRRKKGVLDDVIVYLTVNSGNSSTDFEDDSQAMHAERPGPFVYYAGKVKDMEIPRTPKTELHAYVTPLPSDLSLTSGMNTQTMTFLSSLSTDNADARSSFQYGRDNADSLLETHKKAWEAVWNEGRIDIAGNQYLSQTIASATYNILCSVPDHDDPIMPFFGLSPGGLSRGGLLVPDRPGGPDNDYAGHVFWDMDTWMMPGLMLLHPAMARRMIGARSRVLAQVKKNAQEAGYRGAKFPWEQAATGLEATPKWAGNVSRFQIHITADVAYALRQYLYANDDVAMVSDSGRGLQLALNTARFWQSRTTFFHNPERAEILGVMGPDEYHFNISNSVYTNYNAKLNLLLPQYIIDKFKLQDQVNASLQRELDDFNRTANFMLILFDKMLQYHPQYDGFNNTISIKQSDVILLGYPLMMPMSRRIRQNDLELYEGLTDPSGPSTGTWSMHVVGWLELGNNSRANKALDMMLRNVNEPFKVFSESPVTNHSKGGCANFITAAGGHLQAIIFGYGGVRLHDDHMTIRGHALPNTTTWTLTGLHYRGVTVDVTTEQGHFTVTPTHVPADVVAFLEDGTGQRHGLIDSQPVRDLTDEVNVYVHAAIDPVPVG